MAIDQLAQQRLSRIGYIAEVGDVAPCRGCQADIVWCITTRGKSIPMQYDGEPHWAHCPKADSFRPAARR